MRGKWERSRGKKSIDLTFFLRESRENYREFPSAKKSYVEELPFPSGRKKSKIFPISLLGKKSRKTEIFPREEKTIYIYIYKFSFP